MGILVRTAEVPLRVTHTRLGQLTLRSSPPRLIFLFSGLVGPSHVARHREAWRNRRRRRRKTGSTATGSPGQKPVQVHAQVHLMPGPAKCIFSTHRQIENVSQLSTSGISGFFPPKKNFFLVYDEQKNSCEKRGRARRGNEESAEIAHWRAPPRPPSMIPSYKGTVP